MFKIIISLFCLAALFSCNAPAPVVNNYYTDGDRNELRIYIGEMDSARVGWRQVGIITASYFDVSGFGNIYECETRISKNVIGTDLKTFEGTCWETVDTLIYFDSIPYIYGEAGDSFKILVW